jgi:hypothetical protein
MRRRQTSRHLKNVLRIEKYKKILLLFVQELGDAGPNGRANQRTCKPLQGNESATVLAHVRCRLQNSTATGSATS